MADSRTPIQRSLWVGLACFGLWACSEQAEQPLDAGLDQAVQVDLGAVDAEPDGGRLPVGSACNDDAACEGICVDDGAGARCATACVEGAEACTAPLVCRAIDGRASCLTPLATPHPEGAPCVDGGACADGLACTAAHPAGPTCARICTDDAPCGETRCAPDGVSPRTCLPRSAAVFGCAVEGCARADLLCVTDARPGGQCVSPCVEAGTACPDGGLCTPRQGDGALYCAPVGDRGLGDGCASGGAAACAEGLLCSLRWPGDPGALCTQICDDDCPGALACRRPTGLTEPVCVPAPFGVGDETGEAGAPCEAHGATDCVPQLDCVAGVAHERRCAAPCETTCAAGFRCVDRGLDGRYCLAGDGGLGTPCPDGQGCDDTCLPDEVPEARYCTEACGACPVDYACVGAWCVWSPEPPAAPLGARCDGEGGVCETGLCVAAPDGVARCTLDCAETPCPEGFGCEPVADRSFCFAFPP
jgi:hypothetical protein